MNFTSSSIPKVDPDHDIVLAWNDIKERVQISSAGELYFSARLGSQWFVLLWHCPSLANWLLETANDEVAIAWTELPSNPCRPALLLRARFGDSEGHVALPDDAPDSDEIWFRARFRLGGIHRVTGQWPIDPSKGGRANE